MGSDSQFMNHSVLTDAEAKERLKAIAEEEEKLRAKIERYDKKRRKLWAQLQKEIGDDATQEVLEKLWGQRHKDDEDKDKKNEANNEDSKKQ